MSTVNSEIRLLLNLWEIGVGQGLAKKSELLRRTCKGKEKAAIYLELLQQLVDGGAIALTTDKKVVKVQLTDLGLQKMASGLLANDFMFEGQLVGSRLANAGLKWFRQNKGQAVSENAEAIASNISADDEV